MVSHTWLEKLVNFSISNLPKEVYDVSYSSQKVQFLVKGIDPSITNEGREDFEQSFNCKIKFFLNSRRTGQPISIAMVEGQRQVRDDLCTQQLCSFNCFEINFAMKSNHEQDDFIFPQCSICHQWGQWCHNCPNLSLKKCRHCADASHGSDQCIKSKKQCVNCHGQLSSFYKGCPEFKKYWAWAKKSLNAGGDNRSKFRNPTQQSAAKLNSALPAASYRQFDNSTSEHSGNAPSAQVVTMDFLESKLEEACNKLLMIMQARGIVGFRKEDLSITSDEDARVAKKSNGGSRSNEEEDVMMDIDESTSEFVARIIETQSRLIDSGTANLISNANSRKP
ncbi:hypothetical protein ACOME3_004726 [Neoechinorhynchus agilis]